MARTYHVANMRVVAPSKAVAEKNPDRLWTVKGEFSEDGNALSITSKNITLAMAQSADFAIDLAKGTLTISEGRRGRRESAGLNETEIAASLAALRKSK